MKSLDLSSFFSLALGFIGISIECANESVSLDVQKIRARAQTESSKDRKARKRHSCRITREKASALETPLSSRSTDKVKN